MKEHYQLRYPRREFLKGLAGVVVGVGSGIISSCGGGGGHGKRPNILPELSVEGPFFNNDGYALFRALYHDEDGLVSNIEITKNGQTYREMISPPKPSDIYEIRQRIERAHNTLQIFVEDDDGGRSNIVSRSFDVAAKQEMYNYIEGEVRKARNNGKISDYQMSIDGVELALDDEIVKVSCLIQKKDDEPNRIIEIIGFDDNLEEALKKLNLIRSYDPSEAHTLFLFSMPMSEVEKKFKEFRAIAGI